MTEKKLPRETLREKVDKLINWYELNKPEAGKRIEVACARREFAKTFCGWDNERLKLEAKDMPDEAIYRGRQLFTLAP